MPPTLFVRTISFRSTISADGLTWRRHLSGYNINQQVREKITRQLTSSNLGKANDRSSLRDNDVAVDDYLSATTESRSVHRSDDSLLALPTSEGSEAVGVRLNLLVGRLGGSTTSEPAFKVLSGTENSPSSCVARGQRVFCKGWSGRGRTRNDHNPDTCFLLGPVQHTSHVLLHLLQARIRSILRPRQGPNLVSHRVELLGPVDGQLDLAR